MIARPGATWQGFTAGRTEFATPQSRSRISASNRTLSRWRRLASSAGKVSAELFNPPSNAKSSGETAVINGCQESLSVA